MSTIWKATKRNKQIKKGKKKNKIKANKKNKIKTKENENQ